MEILEVVSKVKNSAREINFSSSIKRDEILRNINREILENVEEIIEFNEKDIVRHPLVKHIVAAYK